jgi:aminocarboxymuconate-semialdehyde decarboxylase
VDPFPPSEARTLARELNDDLENYCSTSPTLSNPRLKRLYGFGLLPLVPGIAVSSLLEAVQQISALPHLRGIVMGSIGIGKGLDDDALDPLWESLEKAELVVFLHPHNGVGGNAWGEKDNGHVLPLALGFPFETTTVCLCQLIYPSCICLTESVRLLLV